MEHSDVELVVVLCCLFGSHLLYNFPSVVCNGNTQVVFADDVFLRKDKRFIHSLGLGRQLDFSADSPKVGDSIE